MSASSCCGTMKVRGSWVWEPAPKEKQGVGSSSRLKFPLDREEEQGGAVPAVYVSALFVYRGAGKGTVFLSLFDL